MSFCFFLTSHVALDSILLVREGSDLELLFSNRATLLGSENEIFKTSLKEQYF